MHRVASAKVGELSMPVLVFEPEGEGPHPGLVIAQHLPVAHAGLELDPFQLDVGRRYAAGGYLVVMPYLFHRWPSDAPVERKREEFRDDWTVADLDAALTLLLDHPALAEGRVGILGHCWGGRVAWLGAVNETRYRACAVFYGGRIRMSFADGGPAPITLARRMRCAVLGVFGNEDTSPSPADVDAYENALVEAGVEHEFHRYDGAGHGFQDFTSAERYRAEASKAAWARALEFFERHLKRG